MTSDDLIRSLAKAEKRSISKANKLLKAFIGSVQTALKNNQKVTFSNFGTFLTFRYPSKTIRDPQGRDHKVLMLPTNVIKWHPSPAVKHKVNQGPTSDESPENSQSPDNIDWAKISTDSSKLKDKSEAEVPVLNLGDSTKSGNAPTSNKIPIRNLETPTEAENIPIKTEIPINELANPTDSISIETKTGEATKKLEASTTPEPPVDKPLFQVKTRGDATDLPDNIAPISKVEDEDDQNKADPEKDKTADESDGPSLENKKPEQPASHSTPGEMVEATESENPRISFEDFVKKSKESALPISEDAETAPDKLEIDKADVAELADNKVVAKNDKQAYIGNVSIEYADLSRVQVDKKLLTLIPEKFARQYQVVPISDTGNVLTVGMIDPEDLEAIELIKKQTGREVVPKLTVTSDINRILDQYSGVETEVTEAITASEKESQDIRDSKTDKEDEKIEQLVEDAPVARIAQSVIKRAVREKASDIHIEPSEEGLDVRFRIDGILHQKVKIPKDIQASLISRIKILSGIKIDESRLPQDGRIRLLIDNRNVDFRVSTMPTAYGEKIVMRILDKTTGVLSLEELGLRGQGFDIVENAIHKSHGMTLVTGPTGSGKTTTLYAIIDRLMDVSINIVTLEDPIEYQIPGINQSQVNSDIDYTFANGLRSILRQDPDVVMIGEIRDKETAEMAVNAALTGHVVLSTLHTNDSAGAGPRMIDMGVEPFLITSSLNTVVGQRLTRKICKNCQQEQKIPDNELAEVKAEIAKMPEALRKKWDSKKLTFFHGKGCIECHDTGYKGRIGIFEVLDVSNKIQALLLERSTASKITEAAIADGMSTMKQDGIDKALDGMTSLEEVWRVTKD